LRWIALKTLIRRECLVIGRYWLVTLAPPAISTTLYFTIFGGVLGPRIGEIGGTHYMSYMVPGLIVLTTIPAAYIQGAAGLLGARNFGYIEELLVAPQPRWVITVGYVASGVARGLVVAAVSTTIALCFTRFEASSVWLCFVALVLIALISASAGCIVGAFANTFERVSTVQGLILVPLAFVGGVFIPVADLPPWAHAVSRANPVFYMVSAVRSSLAGVAEAPLGVSFMVVAAIAAAMLFVAMRVVDAKLRDRVS
jgi:ABC-2 type transport system permease protein